MNLPPGDADVTKLSGGEQRRVGAVQDPARAAGPAAARRADQPSRRRERRLARAASRRVSGHGRRRDARSLLPRQRGQVDSGARPRPGASVRRQLLLVARAEAEAAGSRREAGQRPAEDARPRAGVGPRVGQGPAGQEQGPHQGLRNDGGRAVRRPAGRAGNSDSARPAAGRHGRRGHEPRQVVRRPRDLRERELPPAAGRHRRHHRPQRRRQDHAAADVHGPGSSPTRASSRSARPSNSATSIKAATTWWPTTPSTRKSPAATTRSKWAAAS